MGLLYAQPQTVDSASDEIYGSEIGAFLDDTGEPVNWLTLQDSTFRAEGMVSIDGESFTLASGSKLYRLRRGSFEVDPGLVEEVVDLAPYGVESITGLAPREENLWVLDGSSRKIHKVDLPQ